MDRGKRAGLLVLLLLVLGSCLFLTSGSRDGRSSPPLPGRPPPVAPDAPPTPGSAPAAVRTLPASPPAPAPPAPDAAAGRPVLLRIRAGGRAAIPPGLRILAGTFLHIPPFREDPMEVERDRGEVRFRVEGWTEPCSLGVSVDAPGWMPWRGRAEAATATAPFVGEVDLEPAAYLAPRIAFPAEADVFLRNRVSVAAWDGKEGRWEPAPAPGGRHGLGLEEVKGGKAFGPLPSGRYALWDPESGLLGPPVDLVAGEPTREGTLDLSKAGAVEGRIDLPAWKVPVGDLADARVIVEGEGLLRLHPAWVVPETGAFSVPVPGDRPVTLRAWHPVLQPADPDGTATVVEPRKDVALRLAAGNWCSFRPSAMPHRAPWLPGIRVLRFAGEPEGSPAAVHAVAIRDGEIRFGGYPEGTWTLWIDGPGFAPAVLRGVRLAAGYQDLGEVRMERGSGVRVRCAWKEGADPLPVILRAVRIGEPSYERFVDVKPDPFVTLTGLGPGRFRVTLRDKGGGHPVEREVALDGISDAEMEYDLR